MENQSVRVHEALFHLVQFGYSEGYIVPLFLELMKKESQITERLHIGIKASILFRNQTHKVKL